MNGDEGTTSSTPPSVTCVGECLVMFVPEQPPLPPPLLGSYVATIAGAESNVAAYLASLGVDSAWLSSVGSDKFGDYVLDQLAGYGVNVHHVVRDDQHSTGVAFKEITNGQTKVHYYRHGSAASTMDEAIETATRNISGHILHLTGITPALSSSCERLVTGLVNERPSGTLVSFDVNWRPTLWQERDPSVLLSLARAADIVFVGEDEAASLWHTHGVREIRKLLPAAATLVVKQGERGATVISDDAELFVPALQVDVVELVGAGDAFAAGYLAGVVAGRSLRSCARLGTILAASTLRVPSDIAAPPPPAKIEELLGLSEGEWAVADTERCLNAGG